MAFAALAPFLLQAVAAAATVTSDGSGNAISIQDLTIDGTTYDVTFGTPGDTTFFGSISGATDAVNAIVDAFDSDFADTNNGVYDSNTATDVIYFYVTFSSNADIGLSLR
jgi:hypothetical protein